MRGPIALATIRTSAALALRVSVQASTLLLVARLLGPEQFGAFAGITALAVMLGTLSTFGLHLVLFESLSKTPALHAHILAYALPTTLLSGTALLFAFGAICSLLFSGRGPTLMSLVAIGAAEMLLQPLMALLASEQSALGKPARAQLLQSLPLMFRLLAAIIVGVLQPPESLTVFSYGYFLATAIALLTALKFMSTTWPSPRAWRWPTKQELRKSSSYAVLNITAIGPTELDKTLSANLLTLTAAGLYASGARIVGAVILPVTALILSALPRLYREGGIPSERTARLVRWILGSSVAYGFLLAAVLWCSAPLFVWFFGVEYHGVDETIRWICIAVPGMSLRMTAASVIMALGKPWIRVGLEVVGLVVLVVAAILLTERVGARGMPLALACAEWIMAIGGVALIHRTERGAVRA